VNGALEEAGQRNNRNSDNVMLLSASEKEGIITNNSLGMKATMIHQLFQVCIPGIPFCMRRAFFKKMLQRPKRTNYRQVEEMRDRTIVRQNEIIT
jgi:hypothetical protein